MSVIFSLENPAQDKSIVTKPHIILVMTDQQRFDTIAATGHPYMKTPDLDRLVREGIYFDNCFINAPSCVPSRAALFSGLYPHASGVLKNGQHWQKTWVSNLGDAGYHCVNVGKMHTIPYDAKAGFHERFVAENKDRLMTKAAGSPTSSTRPLPRTS